MFSKTLKRLPKLTKGATINHFKQKLDQNKIVDVH